MLSGIPGRPADELSTSIFTVGLDAFPFGIGPESSFIWMSFLLSKLPPAFPPLLPLAFPLFPLFDELLQLLLFGGLESLNRSRRSGITASMSDNASIDRSVPSSQELNSASVN